MKRALTILLILGMGLACGCAAPVQPSQPDTPPKVAMILEGAATDPNGDFSWNAAAYNGLRRIEAAGAAIHYEESVPASKVEEVVNTLVQDGYGMIFLTSGSFQEAGMAAAKAHPDTHFFILNADVEGKNIASFRIADEEQGFLMGALAAMLSESGIVAFVGGAALPAIQQGAAGFAQGAKYIDEKIEVLIDFTGDFEDNAAAGRMTEEMIAQKADVVAPMANQASLGVVEAAQAGGIRVICSAAEQAQAAPDAAVVAIQKDVGIAFEEAYLSCMRGEMPDTAMHMGIAQGIISIGEYYQNIPQDVQDRLKEIAEKLASGEFTIDPTT